MERGCGARVSMEQLQARRFLSATTLLQDDFSGSTLNQTIWQQPSYNPDGSTFIGRTQFQVLGASPAPKVGRGVLQPNLQSYNPTQLPNQPSFWGSEILSKQAFSPAPGHTLDIQLRAKLDAMPGGGVLGFFLYQVNPDGSHDEIDTELLSNQIASGGNQVETNVYANQPLGAGSPGSFALPSGGKLTGWHTYEMKLDAGLSTNGITITVPSVSWYVDGQRIRTEGTTIPTRPMNVYINFWAPDQGWPEAYNSAIQPTSDPNQNQVWTAAIDSVTVTSAADPAPFSVLTASMKIGTTHVVEGHPNSAIGTVLGTGNGRFKYAWLVEDPNGNVLNPSGTRTANMTNGIASIPKFSGLPSSAAGVYRAWLHVLVKSGNRIDSGARSYGVTAAQPGISISVPEVGFTGTAQSNLFSQAAGSRWTKPFLDALNERG